MLSAEHGRQREELVETLRAQSEECVAAAKETSGFPARLLGDVADATAELATYISSPVVEEALVRFHDSPEARREASKDLTAYLRTAGLEVSDRASFQLRDNNWCAQLVLTVFTDGHQTAIGGHYDSNSGWGTGGCA